MQLLCKQQRKMENSFNKWILLVQQGSVAPIMNDLLKLIGSDCFWFPPPPREIFKSTSGLASNCQLSFWVTSATFLWELFEQKRCRSRWIVSSLPGRKSRGGRPMSADLTVKCVSTKLPSCLFLFFLRKRPLVATETMLQEYILHSQRRKLHFLQRLCYSAH